MRSLLYIVVAAVIAAVVSAGVLLTGCSGRRDADRQLGVVEELIAEHPDSAVAMLLDMDTSRMSDRQQARRELLYAYAHAIHGYPLSLDSVNMQRGDRMFSGRFDQDEVRWLIVKATDARFKGDAVTRLERLKDAEFLAIQLDDRFELAMIYQYLSGVYKHEFNGTVSLYYADRSAGMLRELDCPKQLREARMAIVGAYAVKRDYKSMLDTMLAMRDEVMANATEGYKEFFLEQLARSYDSNGRTAEAIGIWHSLHDGRETSANILAHWASAYWSIGELDSAYMLIQRANSLPHSNEDEYLCRNVEYAILESMGRTSELGRVDSLRQIASDNTMAKRQLEESSLALNVKYDSATREAWGAAARARTRTHIALFVALLCAVVTVAVWLYLRKRNQLLRLEHENDVLRIRTLQDNLFESDRRHRGVSARISELFQTRFRLLDGLAASYFECKETGQEQRRIYAAVKNSISDFSSDAATQELEDVVNGYNDNLMARFREDFPRLSPAQYRLALYLFCGFSLPSISIFTGTGLNNIYVYKSRLKSVITNSDSPRRDEYLAYFGKHGSM